MTEISNLMSTDFGGTDVTKMHIEVPDGPKVILQPHYLLV